MRRLGKHLHEHGCECRYVLANGETHYDILNAYEDGGWQSMLGWIKEQGGVLTHEEVQPHAEEKEPAHEGDADDDSWPELGAAGCPQSASPQTLCIFRPGLETLLVPKLPIQRRRRNWPLGWF